MSVPQDEQTFLINFSLIDEWYLTIQVVRDAECHMITTEPMVPLSFFLAMGLWVMVSHAWMLSLRPWYLEKSLIFQNVERCPQLTLVYFLSLQSTYGQSSAFPSKSKLRNALFILGQAGCRYRPFPLLPYWQLH